MADDSSLFLSKSQYTRFLLCSKLFWLSRHDRSRLAPPSFQRKQLFAQGAEVGRAARDLFPGGREIPYTPEDYPAMVRLTRELLDEGVRTIYEASFLFNNVFVAVDILHYGEGGWQLYEVKSGTGVRDYYLDDGAIQYYVLAGSGITPESVRIVHINNRYVREGELDLHRLFSFRDITEEVRARQEGMDDRIDRMEQVMKGEEPRVPIGPHCLSPYECGAHGYCWKTLAGIPENSVFTLGRSHLEERFDLYRRGILRVSEIPPEGRNSLQQLQIRGEEHRDGEMIGKFLSPLASPITHLDFESFQQPLPEYPGTKPYSQIPFQYSLHIEGENGLEHREFLGPVGEDPRRALAESLIGDIPGKGTILAYNRSFERRIIGSLAGLYPDLAPALRSLAARIEDLMTPFQKGWYYHPAMGGSYSIKRVLPALVPEMENAYGALPGVHNGAEASAVWNSLAGEEDREKGEEIRRGLLAYCELDTLAMVRILEKLRELSEIPE